MSSCGNGRLGRSAERSEAAATTSSLESSAVPWLCSC